MQLGYNRKQIVIASRNMSVDTIMVYMDNSGLHG